MACPYFYPVERFADGNSGELFLRQARAYAESYLRRKAEPEEQAKNPHRR